MNAAQLFDIYTHVYKPERTAKNEGCINTPNLDCCLINAYTSPADLWYKLVHAIFHSKLGGNIFIDTGSRIHPGSPLPYSVSLSLMAVSLSVNSDIVTIDSGPSSTIIITVYKSNIRISRNILDTIDFSQFNTRIASNMYCSTINLRKPADVPWMSQVLRTTPCSDDSKIDIVFTLAGAHSPTDNEELRLALRSIEKHAKDLGNIYIATDRPPEWITNVNIIHSQDTYTNNKDANLISKLLKACDTDSISDRFIFWSDDQVLTSDISLKNITPVYNSRGLDHFMASTSKWGIRMRHTLEVVRAHGGDTSCNWDSHIPQPIDKVLFSTIMGSLDFHTSPGLCVNTAYFGIKGESKQWPQSHVKLTYETTDPRSYEFNKIFVGYNDDGYRSGLREVLLDTFNEPCIYEK